MDKLRVPDPNDPKYWRESFDVKSYRDDFAIWRKEVLRIHNNLRLYSETASERSYTDIANEIANLLERILGLDQT